jgi:hypothetical protein
MNQMIKLNITLYVNVSTPETTRRMVERSRAIAAGDNEPTNTEERSVVDLGGALYVNLSDYAKSTHDFEKGDDVLLHTVDDGVCIEPLDSTEGRP